MGCVAVSKEEYNASIQGQRKRNMVRRLLLRKLERSKGKENETRFKTKHGALEWERTFQQQKASNLNITFASFVEVYTKDMEMRLRRNTWHTQKHIIEAKLLPAFGSKRMNDIRPADVIQWQNEMIGYRDEKGNPYSETYLKTLHNQLSAIFNHAVRFYELKSNSAAKAGNMGKKQGKEMLFWTKEEYKKFTEVMMDKSLSYYAFQMLYWCGIRLGELLALTPTDFDFEKSTVTISKSYRRLLGDDIITDPKSCRKAIEWSRCAGFSAQKCRST